MATQVDCRSQSRLDGSQPIQIVDYGGMMKEIDFELAVVDAARLFGWKAVGHRPMRTKHGWATGWLYDGVGWPDLTVVHAGRGTILTAELKVKTNLSDEQKVWAQTLTQTADASEGHIIYKLWRPTDWDDIKQTLSFGKVR